MGDSERGSGFRRPVLRRITDGVDGAVLVDAFAALILVLGIALVVFDASRSGAVDPARPAGRRPPGWPPDTRGPAGCDPPEAG